MMVRREKEPLIKTGGKLIISGKKGESLFYSPYSPPNVVAKTDYKSISEQLTKYMNLALKAKEERLLVLIGALSMEEALDSFLSAYIPDYKRILENTDFTLSMKIEIAFSLRLIPRHILHTADLVRGIRNKFAHDLSIDCFDSLDKKLKNRLRVRFKEFCPEEEINNVELSKLFEQIIQFIVSALGIYQFQSKAAKEYIYSEDFLNELNKRIKGTAS
jgi:hypothetical protein